MKRNLVVALLMALLLVSCDWLKMPEEDVSTLTLEERARNQLYNIMQRWYYWYDRMPEIDKEEYEDPYELLEALRDTEHDVWSFVSDYDEFMASMQEGEFTGFGLSFGLDPDMNMRVAIIYKNSPLYSQGVRRGWTLETLNGVDLAAVVMANDADSYNAAFAPATGTFVFTNPEGESVTVNATKASFITNTVLHFDTLHLSSGVAGHLVFESFTLPAATELDSAFAFFKANNVNDLILDLRYNGGGYLEVARQLGSYIFGNGHSSSVFCSVQFNDQQTSSNESYFFEETVDHPLNLTRLVAITSRSTASASEAVINGLDPFIEVVSVGDTTYGKPMGMSGWEYQETYIFYPVTFKLVNSANFGDYFDGLPPTILATDDITHDFNDRDEECLRRAIEYLEGTSSDKKSGPFHKVSLLTDKPEWMKNAIIMSEE